MVRKAHDEGVPTGDPEMTERTQTTDSAPQDGAQGEPREPSEPAERAAECEDCAVEPESSALECEADEASDDQGDSPDASGSVLPTDPIAGSGAAAPALGERVRTAFGRFDRWRRRVQEPWREGGSLVEIATSVVHDVKRCESI